MPVFRRASRLSPEFALLGFLSQAPAHGYELHARLTSELGEIWHCSQSQTYNILARLEAQGFIEGRPHPQEKRPDRRELRLTESGRARFEAWLWQVSPPSVHAIRVEFLTRLYFQSARHPQAARQSLEAQIHAARAHLERLRRRLESLPPAQTFNRLGLSLRISQLQTLADWLEARAQDFSEQGEPS